MSRAEIFLPADTYLSVGALALELRVSEHWVRARMADGRIPSYKVDRIYLLPVSQLPAFLVDAYGCERCEAQLRPARGWLVMQGAGEPDETLCSACLQEWHPERKSEPAA